MTSIQTHDARRWPGATWATERHPSPRRPWLVGDIGGTNARFALITEPAGDPTQIEVLACAGHHDLASLIRDYREQVDSGDPVLACIALAGPVTGDQCRTTNAELQFSIEETARVLGLRRLHIVNDFAATALATLSLREENATRIGAAAPVPGLTTAVVGPGTGLGVAALVPSPGRHPIVVPSEGGHVLLPVYDEIEIEVIRAAKAGGMALTAEMVVSGPGLTRLHNLLGQVRGVPTERRSPEDICARALACTDDLCAASLQMFCTFLGAVASGVALTTGARGGVYLAGGILPRIANFLDGSDFRSRFETNPVMGPYLARIATTLITDPYSGLRGAATALEIFLVDLDAGMARPA